VKQALLIRQVSRELTQIQLMVAEIEGCSKRYKLQGDKDYHRTVALNLPETLRQLGGLVAIAKD